MFNSSILNTAMIILLVLLFILGFFGPTITYAKRKRKLATERGGQIPIIDKTYSFVDNKNVDFVVKEIDVSKGVVFGIPYINFPPEEKIIDLTDHDEGSVHVVIQRPEKNNETEDFDINIWGDQVDGLEAWNVKWKKVLARTK